MSIRPGCTLSIGLSLVASLCACGSGPDDVDARFYYPIAELHEGLVYVYEPPQPGLGPPQYWYMRSLQTPDSTMLVSTLYSPDYQPLQLTNERVVAAGSLLRDLRLYTPTDSASTAMVATVLQPALFSFEAPDPDRVLVSAVRLTEVSAANGGDEDASNQDIPDATDSGFRQNQIATTYTVTRNRRYLRDTTFAWESAELPAQLWTVRELIEQDSAGVLAVESAAVEIYAAGLGLVYRERRFANGESEAYLLKRRMPMDSLTAQLGRRQSQ